MPSKFKIVLETGQTTEHPRHWAETESKTMCGKDVGETLRDIHATNEQDCAACSDEMEKRGVYRCSHHGPLMGDFCGYCYSRVVPVVVPEPEPFLRWPQHMVEEVRGARYIRERPPLPKRSV